LREESATYRYVKDLISDSSGEFWAMRESVTQQINDAEEDYFNCKRKSRMNIKKLCFVRSYGQYMCQQPR